MTVCSNDSYTVSTYALGSCVGMVAYDPQRRAGGILHVMLPDSKLSPEKATRQPSMFVDTGVRVFMHALQGVGCERRRLRVLLAGGANVIHTSDMFKIGERNIAAMRKLLGAARLPIRHEQVGGINNRTVHLTLATGICEIKEPSGTRQFDLKQ